MRILMVAHEYYPKGSGIANVAYNLKQSMERQGHKVEICSPIGPDIPVKGTEQLIARFGGYGIVLFWFKAGRILKRLQSKYDIIYLHNPLLFTKLPSKRIVCVVHTLFYFTFKDSDWKNLKKIPYYLGMMLLEFLAYSFQKRFKYIVTSPKTVKELKHYGISKSMPIIYNGFDFSAKGAVLPKQLQFKKHGKQLLYVGRLAHKKNIPKLLGVFAQLRALDKGFELTLIPGRTESAHHIKPQAGVRILKNITHEQLLTLYKRFDYFISASMYEGFPLTLAEACANGLIPILSPIEVFKHVQTTLGKGLIVDFNSPDAAQKIYQFCQKPQDAKAIEKISGQLFNWDYIASQYIKSTIQ